MIGTRFKYGLLLACFVYITPVFGQNHWELLHSSRHIQSIDFVDDNIGFMLASVNTTETGIYKTYNGGENWTMIGKLDKLFRVGRWFGGLRFEFLDENNGLLSDYGNCYLTNDGGYSWKKVQIGAPFVIASTYPVSVDTFFVRARDTVEYTDHLFRTADRGSTWNKVGFKYHVYQFLDSRYGISSRYDSLAITRDGGQSWEQVIFPDSLDKADITSVSALNRELIYFSARWNINSEPWEVIALYRTRDFFKTVEFVTFKPDDAGWGDRFFIPDSERIMYFSEKVYRFFPIDKKWYPAGTLPTEYIRGDNNARFEFFNNQVYYFTSNGNGSILQVSKDCCWEWEILNRYVRFTQVNISPNNEILITGNADGFHSHFSATYQWNFIKDGLNSVLGNAYYGDLSFMDNGTGIVNAWNGQMQFELVNDSLVFTPLATAKPGYTEVVGNDIWVLDMDWINGTESYLNSLFRSQDLAVSWDSLFSWTHPSELGIRDYFPISTSRIVVTGENGYIGLIENNTIKPVSSGTRNALYGIEFANENIGWVLGSFVEDFWDEANIHHRYFRNLLLRTVDGGDSWEALPETPYYFNDIIFKDEQTGWAVGMDTLTRSGVILKTRTGGYSWQEEVNKLPYPLLSIDIRGSSAIAGGEGGSLLGYNMDELDTYPPSIPTENPSDPIILSLFPNPATSYSMVQIDSEVAGPYKISLINSLGRRISQVSGIKAAGKYSYSLYTSGMKPGLYLVAVQIRGVSTSKILIIEP